MTKPLPKEVKEQRKRERWFETFKQKTNARILKGLNKKPCCHMLGDGSPLIVLPKGWL